MKKLESQNKQIAAWLKKGKTIAPLQALNQFGCFRLASRINDLKSEPYNLNIESKIIYEHPVKFAQYKLKRK